MPPFDAFTSAEDVLAAIEARGAANITDAELTSVRSSELDRLCLYFGDLSDQAQTEQRRIREKAAGRDLTVNQRRDFDRARSEQASHGKLAQRLSTLANQRAETARRAAADGPVLWSSPDVDRAATRGHTLGGPGEYRDGEPLRDGQSMLGFVRAKGLDRGVTEQPLSLHKMLRGSFLGEWHGADAERRAMSEGVLAGGGYAVPTPLAAEMIDLARAQSRVLQAGAATVPMTSQTLKIAQWTGDPQPAWRAESATISEDDGTLGAITLTAKSYSLIVRLSRELIADAPNVEQQLRRAIAAQVALGLDFAALMGTGASNQPTGLINTAGVDTTTLGAGNGEILADWAWVVAAVGAVEDANEAANALIAAPRTLRDLGTLQDTTDQPLARPPYLANLATLSTTQVPVNQTVGGATDCSTAFVGDWSQLLLGMREQLTIIPLVERYADVGEVGVLCHVRADVAVARPAAFQVVAGIRPANGEPIA